MRHVKCVFVCYVHSVFVRQAVCDVLYVFVRVLWISPRPLPLWYQAGATHWQWGNDDAPANRHHSSTRLSKDKPNARRSQLSISRCTPEILFEENCDHKLWWSRPRTIPPKKYRDSKSNHKRDRDREPSSLGRLDCWSDCIKK